jgi:hypothetical protein
MDMNQERRSEIWLQNIADDDCGVIALQALTRRSREDVEELAKECYTPGSGTDRLRLANLLTKIGLAPSHVGMEDRATPATFAIEHEDGRYLLFTKGHVMALIDGDLHNSTGSWSDPLQEVWRVK